MTDTLLWNCPIEGFLIPLAQGWSMSTGRAEPSFQGTGHGRFAVLLWREEERKIAEGE